ncbi:MAG: TSUP family transporter [Clostridia bacterium]|nr:TSUP family transporter [Clostridia bacterium]
MSKKKIALLILIGSVTGFVNGFFGGGGGMIVVPMLTLILGFNEKVSHATAIAVILPVTAVSVVTYFISGSFNVEIITLIVVAVGVTVGGVVGALLLKKIKPSALAKIFAVVMLVAGVKMIIG